MKTNNFLAVAARLRKGTRAPVPVTVHKRHTPAKAPRLSIILLDWTCRERFNTLDWLNQQDVPREDYELIWVELYDRVVPEAMAKADTVITLNQTGMYHKHMGYNAGLLASNSDLICVCDSDAVFPRNFVTSVLKSFHPNRAPEPIPLVLMHHELRTSFLYPDELTDAEDLKDADKWKWWPVVPNAGACMTVRRADAIRFGGFDEDESYRGYLCGPYDLGWRLINAGLPQVWHDDSCVLWHFAHPDPVGANGFGPQLRLLLENTHPHVDMHALTAVDAFSTGRMQPRKENPEIFALRMADRRIGTPFEAKYADMTGQDGFSHWFVWRMRAEMFVDIYATAAWQIIVPYVRRGLRWIFGKHYARVRSIVLHRLLGLPLPGPTAVVGRYRRHNIVRSDGAIYGVDEMFSTFDPHDPAHTGHPAIVRGVTVREVRRKIRNRARATALIAREIGRHRERRIVAWQHRFYAVPDGFEIKWLHDNAHRSRPDVLSSESVDGVTALVDAAAGRA